MYRFHLFSEIAAEVPLIALQRGQFGLFVPREGSLEPPFRIQRGEVLPVGGTDVFPLGVRQPSAVSLSFEPTTRGIAELLLLEDGDELFHAESWGRKLRTQFCAQPGRCYELRLSNPCENVVGYCLVMTGRQHARPLQRLMRQKRELVGSAGS